MKKKTFKQLVAALCMGGMTICTSCTNEGPVLPSQLEIEQHIVGKWKRTILDDKPLPTNEYAIKTYMADGTGMFSTTEFIQEGTNSVWCTSMPMTYKINDFQISESLVTPTNHYELEFLSEVLAITDEASLRRMTKVLWNGSVQEVNRQEYLIRVTKDYSKDIIGLWKGIESVNDTYGDSNHYWAFKADGTYSYFTQNDEGTWGTFDNIVNEYTVDGDWMAMHWVTTDNIDNHECWDIDKIEGDRMYWRALRDRDGKQEIATMVLERVKTDPTGIVADLIGKTWVSLVRYANGKPITNQDFEKMTGKWQSKEFHTGGVVRFNEDGTMISMNDGNQAMKTMYSIKDGKVYISEGSTTGEIRFDKQSGLLVSEAKVPSFDLTLTTVYMSLEDESEAEIKTSIQGGWTNMIVGFDGVVYAPDVFLDMFTQVDGEVMAGIFFDGDNYKFRYSGDKMVEGKINLLPTGQIEIGYEDTPGTHLMLYYRKTGDVLQPQEFEIDGRVCSLIYERIRNQDFSQPFNLLGNWNCIGSYDGILTSDPALVKELKRILPDVTISDSNVPLSFAEDGTGIIIVDSTPLPFTYTVQKLGILMKIVCQMKGSTATFDVWANNATGYIYLYGTDAATGRNNVMTYSKE